MKRIYSALTIGIIFSLALFSQDTSTRIVKGKVIDKTTGNPVGLEIQFEDARGKKFKIKSDPKTGQYEQLLNSSEKYTLTFISSDVLREDQTFTPTPPDASFEPQIHNFEVFVLKPNVVLYEFDVFSANSSDISSNGLAKLEDLKTMMRINRSLYIKVEVHQDDSSKNLNDARLAKIKELTDGWGRFNRKVEYVKSDKQSSNKSNDVRIIVDKVEDSMK